MWKSIVAIAIGAGLGALGRWQLGVLLNRFFPEIPPGTLAANLLGGYIIGLATGFLDTLPALAPEWRLLIITGFCGGLTTFSTFSVEIISLLQQGRAWWAGGAILIHVGGSLVMTFAGLGTIFLVRR